MIYLDSCLLGSDCEGCCFNSLYISSQPTLTATNTSSFVGVTAVVEAECGCPALQQAASCRADPCQNGGACKALLNRGGAGPGYSCQCSGTGANIGPNCEKLDASFRKGWALHRGFESCENTSLSLSFTSRKSDGLLLYQVLISSKCQLRYIQLFL